MLTREQFFDFKTPAPVEVSVPALGGVVYVRVLSAGQRDALEVSNARLEAQDFRARLTALVACSADGKPLFAPADEPSLSALPAYVLDPVVLAATKLNRLTPDDISELEKNF